MKAVFLKYSGLSAGIVLSLCLLPIFALAQDDVWLGGTGNWSDPTMWSNGVPTATSNVMIDNGNGIQSQVVMDVASAFCNTLTVDAGDNLYIQSQTTLTVNGSSIAANGSIWMDSYSILHIADNQSVTLTGQGGISLNGAVINGGTATLLTNASTIGGSGVIGSPGGMTFVNQGTIGAGVNLLINPPGGTTNSGLFVLERKNAHLTIQGPFTNFSGTTLTGGTYKVSGTLMFDHANIATNAANIHLTGTSSAIVDENGLDALRNLSSTTSKGTIVLMSGKTLATSGAYANAGKMILSKGTHFTAGTTYTQNAGNTKVYGTLNASSGMNVQGGKLFGFGTILTTVASSGSVTPGGAAKNGGTLSLLAYTENTKGSLNVSILNAAQYGRLAVTNGVSLDGTLNITLAKNFLPEIGTAFTILSGTAITGQFATVKGLSINGSEHFEIVYNPTNVTLTVVAGP